MWKSMPPTRLATYLQPFIHYLSIIRLAQTQARMCLTNHWQVTFFHSLSIFQTYSSQHVTTHCDREVLCNPWDQFLLLSLVCDYRNLLALFVLKLSSEYRVPNCYWNSLPVYFRNQCGDELTNKHHRCVSNQGVPDTFQFTLSWYLQKFS